MSGISYSTNPQLTLPRLKFDNAFAFGAPKLIGHNVTIWMLSYGDLVIVNGMDISTCISNLLYSSHLGVHTSILFLNNTSKATNSLFVARYAWEHQDQRPNTHTLPLSCAICHGIRTWCKARVVNRVPGERFAISCLHKNPDGTKCSGRYEVAARPPSTALEAPYVGTWYWDDMV